MGGGIRELRPHSQFGGAGRRWNCDPETRGQLLVRGSLPWQLCRLSRSTTRTSVSSEGHM